MRDMKPGALLKSIRSTNIYRCRNVFLLYAATALAALFPSWCLFFGRVPGSPYTDTYQHIWTLWWPAEALAGRLCLPSFTTLLNYPAGGFIYPIDILNGLALAPLIVLLYPLGLTLPLMPPLMTLALMANLALGAYGAFLLACRLTRRKVVSVLAGFIYGFSAYALSNVENGFTEGTSLAWLPLFILSLFRTLDSPSKRNALAGGLFFFLTLMSNWYYAVAGLLFIPLFFAGNAPALVKKARGSLGRPAALALLLGTGLCLALPFAGWFMRYMTDPSSLMTHSQGAQSLWTIHLSDLVHYFAPGKAFTNPNFPYVHATYLGWVPLALALLCGGVLRRTGLLWLACAVVFFGLSLGPYLRIHYGSQALVLLGREWTLPYNWLATHVPVFSQMSFPYRFVVIVSLSLALLSVLGLAPLMRRTGRRAQALVTGILSLLALLEVACFAPLPYPLSTAPTPFMPAMHALGALDTGGGVIDVPNYTNTVEIRGHVDDPNKLLRKYTWGRYFYSQTLHHRGIPYTIRDELPPLWQKNTFLSFLNHLETCIRNGERPGSHVDNRRFLERDLQALRELDFRYVVVHDDLLRSGATVHGFLEYFLGKPRVSGSVRIYRLR